MARDLNVDQIKKLWILQLIVEEASFKKAAARAHVTPSAVSQTLTALEQAYGRPLIIRERGVVEPTADALAVLEIVKPAFEAFDRLRGLGQQEAPRISWINFGTYESIAIDVLPGLVRSFRTKLPQTKLGVRISRTANLLTMVRKGELCSALITETDDLDKFYVKSVGSDRLGLYVGKGTSLEETGFRACEKYGVGSLAAASGGMPRYFTKFMKGLGKVKSSLVSDSFEALRAVGAAGVAPVVLPHRVASRLPDLVEVDIPGASFSGEHELLVVSQANCDREEVDFISAEVSLLLKHSRGVRL
jgi:DNA-binding transcriptional LysR family regulator